MSTVGYGEVSDPIKTLPSQNGEYNSQSDLPLLMIVMLSGVIINNSLMGQLALIISEAEESVFEPNEYASELQNQLQRCVIIFNEQHKNFVSYSNYANPVHISNNFLTKMNKELKINFQYNFGSIQKSYFFEEMPQQLQKKLEKITTKLERKQFDSVFQDCFHDYKSPARLVTQLF